MGRGWLAGVSLGVVVRLGAWWDLSCVELGWVGLCLVGLVRGRGFVSFRFAGLGWCWLEMEACHGREEWGSVGGVGRG